MIFTKYGLPEKIKKPRLRGPAWFPKKNVVGPQKTKICSPENQEFKMADPIFCPAGSLFYGRYKFSPFPAT